MVASFLEWQLEVDAHTWEASQQLLGSLTLAALLKLLVPAPSNPWQGGSLAMTKECITRLQSLAHTCLAQPAAAPTVASAPQHVLKRHG